MTNRIRKFLGPFPTISRGSGEKKDSLRTLSYRAEGGGGAGLVCKREALSLISNSHIKRLLRRVWACNLGPGQVELGGLQELTGQPLGPTR